MSNEVRFKVTNTTAKEPKFVDGRDVRKLSERVGHFIEVYKDDRKQTQLLSPGKFAIIGYIDEWLVDQERAGEIKIEEIKDMGSALDAFRHQAKKAAEEAVPVAKPVTPEGRIKVSEMGHSKADENTTKDPDGAPNFVVKAGPTGANVGVEVAPN